MSSQFIPITAESFRKHFSSMSRTAFITQTEIGKKLRKTVEAIAHANGELFVSEARIITERLTPLGEKEVKRIAQRHGFCARCERDNMRLKYLYSDGYGHYSNDFYEYLEFTTIHISIYQPKKEK